MTRAFESVKTASIDGTTLAYEENGNGAPVVFVHGTASDLRTWKYQIPSIGGSYRAIAYSRRYARPNDDIKPGVDDQMHPHVDDLVAFLKTIDATPAHLVGSSWGAFICLLTAIRYPEAVRSLVLEEPPAPTLFVSRTPPPPFELLRLLVRRPRSALALVKFGAQTVGPAEKAFRRGDDETAVSTFGRGVLGEKSFRRLPDDRKQQMRENVATARAQLLGAGFPPLEDNDVRGVRVPTLLATGERSPSIFLRITDRLQELLPNVERVTIPGASHLMHEENADETNRAILRFLAQMETRH